ncbi:RHS domain-containing protein [Proteus alimentorum]|uniref:RHS domain-containing protein n=1 Tax=Proteus alimentorum TaxID=1973495 RepID=A0ABS0IWZ4_9GAMM|nr:RHS domain-containing protein [Proteus alimentorum]MBG2880558.1 RHS domain-containing protein [Proteus alimentorum]
MTEHQFIPSDAQGAFLQLAQQQQKGRVTHRITAKGYQDYHYDINGRLTQKVVYQHGFRAKTWYYQWNTLNQLIACFNPEGECWRYIYDAFGRRLSKHKVVDNRPTLPLNSPFKDKRVQRVDYLWSGNQMVQETPIYADGTPAYDPQIQWLYQPNEIIPTARYQRGKLHYVVTDHQGTPREIFSEKGIVSWAGRLNTWGQIAFWQSHDNYADNDPEYTECHFRFAGQYEDKESGLYYNRFRYYDKDTGQYISPDPIGLLGGFNPYGYVHCPTGWVDPFGVAGEDCDKLLKLNSAQRKNISNLREGKDVTVRNVEEARQLLDNMPELRPHIDLFPAKSGELYRGTVFGDIWKQPVGTYRGDLYNIRNPLSDVVHESSNKLHDLNPHYNILFKNGTKVGIIIVP